MAQPFAGGYLRRLLEKSFNAMQAHQCVCKMFNALLQWHVEKITTCQAASNLTSKFSSSQELFW